MTAEHWTPLDDLGRTEAAVVYYMRQHSVVLSRVRHAQVGALQKMDVFLALLSDGEIDWSEATDEEAAEMMTALDTIRRVRAILAGVIGPGNSPTTGSGES